MRLYGLKDVTAMVVSLTAAGCLPKKTDAGFKVAAGCEISKLKDYENYEAVVKVSHIGASKDSTVSCTATWVSDQTLLTAWHCLPKPKGQSPQPQNESTPNEDAQTEDGVFITLPDGKTRVWSNKLITPEAKYKNKSTYDIALVVFKSGTFKGEPLAIDVSPMSKTKGPQSAENLGQGKALIIGFGKTDHDNVNSSGKKTFGYVEQPHWDVSNKSWSFKGFKSENLRQNASNEDCVSVANTQGDSGGPLIHNGIVIGVSSAHREDGPYLHGIYASTAFNLEMIHGSGAPVRGLTEGDYSKRDSQPENRDSPISDQDASGKDGGRQMPDGDEGRPNRDGDSSYRKPYDDNGGREIPDRSSACTCGIDKQGACLVSRGGTPIASTPMFGPGQCREECSFLQDLPSVKTKCK